MSRKKYLIWQSCTLQKFVPIHNRITRFCELLDGEKTQFVTQNNYADYISNSLASTQVKIDIDSNENLSYAELLDKVKNALSDITDVISSNVFVFKDFATEYTYFSLYLSYKHSKLPYNEVLSKIEVSDYDFTHKALYDFVIQMIIIDELKIKSHILICDPLQAKFKFYTANADLVRLYYSHRFNGGNNVYVYPNTSKMCTLNYLPFEQYGFLKETDFAINLHTDRKYDFVFGCSRGWTEEMAANRHNTITATTSLNQLSTYVTVSQSSQIPKIDINNNKPALEYESYLDVLSNSYTTLIIESLDNRFFSIRRFFEAIVRGCIPLVEVRSDYESGFDYNYEFCNIVHDYLCVDSHNAEELQKKVLYIKNNYDMIINIIVNSSYMKNFANTNFYKVYSNL